MDWNQKLQSKIRMGRYKTSARFVMSFAAICMVVWGIYRGEVPVILSKAVNVCLECIGLG